MYYNYALYVLKKDPLIHLVDESSSTSVKVKTGVDDGIMIIRSVIRKYRSSMIIVYFCIRNAHHYFSFVIIKM